MVTVKSHDPIGQVLVVVVAQVCEGVNYDPAIYNFLKSVTLAIMNIYVKRSPVVRQIENFPADSAFSVLVICRYIRIYRRYEAILCLQM